MAENQNTNTPGSTLPAKPETKKTQVSTTLNDKEFARLQEVRWEGRHNKLSDAVREAIAFYCNAKLDQK